MKIIVVHNFYRSSVPSGEDVVVQEEVELLNTVGHDVILVAQNNSDLFGAKGAIKGGVSYLFNPSAAEELEKAVRRLNPDVIHVHNLFPQMGVSVIRKLVAMRIPTLMTLHNYRLICSNGLLLNNGIICEKCVGSRSRLQGVFNRCYRNSLIATVPITLGTELCRYYMEKYNFPNCFIALSRFQKDMLVRGGIPSHKIVLKPNCYNFSAILVPWEERRNQVIYLGRLSNEKGVDILIKAWKEANFEKWQLIIVGEGPLRSKIEELGSELVGSGKIVFKGQLEKKEAHRLLAYSKLLVLPSICYEGFPLVIREAFAHGIGVVTSDIGSMDELVQHGETGWKTQVGNVHSLAQTLNRILLDEELLKRVGENARRVQQKLYSRDINYKKLIDIYESVIGREMTVV